MNIHIHVSCEKMMDIVLNSDKFMRNMTSKNKIITITAASFHLHVAEV